MAVSTSVNTASLQTESRNLETAEIDVVDTLDMCYIINAQDHNVAPAVKTCVPEIARTIDLMAERAKKGGRVLYIGAGTSGRLGVLDASEIPPTFSAPYSQFVALMAGGDHAIRNAVEGAEDSTTQPISDLELISPPISAVDTLIGIAASGRTPYVLAGLEHAKSKGLLTVGVSCVNPSAMRGRCECLIECVVGPEVVTGSTRLKSGTATKLILNMLSTGVMIRIGKTHGNLMVDVKSSNLKLIDRARRIFRTVLSNSSCPSSLTDEQIDALIVRCEGSVKLALVVEKVGCSVEEGKKRIDEAGGVLKKAWEVKGDETTAESATAPAPLVNGDEKPQAEMVLCIDAGGTKCAAVIASKDGILARAEAGPCNFVTLGHDLALSAISTAVGAALASLPSASSTSPASPTTPALPLSKPLFTAVWVGGAGLDRKGDIQRVRERLMKLFALNKPEQLLVTNDAALLAAAVVKPGEESKSKNGIVLITGTGSITYSFNISSSSSSSSSAMAQPNLSVTPLSRTSGWGYLLGDEGSAYSIGREALRRALRTRDLGLPPTALHTKLADYFGLDAKEGGMGAVISAVYAPNWTHVGPVVHEDDSEEGGMDPKLRIAGLARVVVGAAFPDGETTEGNEEALDIVRTVARSLVASVRPLVVSSSLNGVEEAGRHTRVKAEETTLVMGGGLSQVKPFQQLIVDELRKDGIIFESVEKVEDPAGIAVGVLVGRFLQNLSKEG